jgi:hypothetical protein
MCFARACKALSTGSTYKRSTSFPIQVVNFLSKARAILVGVGIVYPNVYRMGRRRGVGIGVSAVCAHYDENHARLIDVRGMRMSEAELGTQFRCARRGGTRYAKDILLLVSVELFLFRGP